MSALPSEIDDRSGPSVRAPDLLDLLECYRRIEGVRAFLDERADLVPNRTLRVGLYRALEHLENAKAFLEQVISDVTFLASIERAATRLTEGQSSAPGPRKTE